MVRPHQVFTVRPEPVEGLQQAQPERNLSLQGAGYVLVDDVSNLVGTSAELANFVQLGGGRVCDVGVLVNAGREPGFVPAPRFVQLLERRFGNEFFENFGIRPEALAANEGR